MEDSNEQPHVVTRTSLDKMLEVQDFWFFRFERAHS